MVGPLEQIDASVVAAVLDAAKHGPRLVDARRHDSGGLAPVDLVGALLEGRGEAAERGVEHRAHQQAERAAAELVVDEELDLAGLVARRA